MSPQNMRENATAELAQAEESLRAAQVLADAGLATRAMSDAYYAMFRAVRALLFTLGLEPRTHGGALRLFNQHFVRTGKLEAEHLSLLTKAQYDRTVADYEARPVFTAKQAKAAIASARVFIDRAADLVRESSEATGA